jgi:hypothetical protein
LFEDLSALREYALYYVSARVDVVKHRVRKAILWAAAGVMGMVAGAVVLITAIVLLLDGIAAGLAALLGGRRWAGDLITGIVVLAVIPGGILGDARLDPKLVAQDGREI